jgi:hypothetical protein
MIKKIYISVLVLILLVSTTGLTYTFHVCKMMSEEEAELCEMEEMKMMSHCCSEGNENGQTIRGYQQDCCESRTIENRISDEFIFVKSENVQDNILIVLLAESEILNSNPNLNLFSKNNLHNNSPPGRENNLFIINSSFLI